jgi:hypothetical protein
MKRRKMVSVRFTPEEYERLQTTASGLMVNISDLIRALSLMEFDQTPEEMRAITLAGIRAHLDAITPVAAEPSQQNWPPLPTNPTPIYMSWNLS